MKNSFGIEFNKSDYLLLCCNYCYGPIYFYFFGFWYSCLAYLVTFYAIEAIMNYVFKVQLLDPQDEIAAARF